MFKIRKNLPSSPYFKMYVAPLKQFFFFFYVSQVQIKKYFVRLKEERVKLKDIALKNSCPVRLEMYLSQIER